MLKRYFIKFSYNGTAYHGWQLQENAVAVQQKINEALQLFFGCVIETIGAGRTDTGVHAEVMFAHFDAGIEFKLNDLIYKLNRLTPKDIAISDVYLVKDNAHARFSALTRSYEYRIALKKEVFLNELAYYHHGDLDINKMNEACEILKNCKDFKSFCKSHSDAKTTLCDLYHAEWKRKNNLLVFEVSANRFLRNMVRALVGTLLEVGSGKISIQELQEIINLKNRSSAGPSVPANGLFLTDITYPKEIFING